ncbi:MAG: methyltransferase domain-containing protein [Anaerolineales bacterium]|nr:methyltransferase domain-containing protein [Anaerolineales bacterium]
MNKTEKFWDKIANRYAKQELKLEEIEIKTVEKAKNHLNVGDVVLDYGSGPGTMTNAIASYVNEIHAIDISSKMIELAKAEADEREIENIHYAQATIFDERFKAETFDVILAFNILHLLEDTHIILQRINKLLRPGGILISATPCLGEKNAFIGVFISLLSRIGIFPYLKILKISELEDLIVSGNFQIVVAENIDPGPPSHFIVARKLPRT